MIKVCPECSMVDMDALKSAFGEDQLEFGCVEQCQGFDGKSFGLLNGELVIAENTAAFIEAVKTK